MGSLSLLQGIFPTKGSNPGLPHCRRILYQLSHKGSPRTLEWVAFHFLQGIFLTQESNQGLLHCRWILYQLSYLGSPMKQLFHVYYQHLKWSIIKLKLMTPPLSTTLSPRFPISASGTAVYPIVLSEHTETVLDSSFPHLSYPTYNSDLSVLPQNFRMYLGSQYIFHYLFTAPSLNLNHHQLSAAWFS